jgi:hypothetical protein
MDGSIELFPHGLVDRAFNDAGNSNAITDSAVPDRINDEANADQMTSTAQANDAVSPNQVGADAIADVGSPRDESGATVGCLSDTDCRDPQMPRCESVLHLCVECVLNGDCASQPGTKCNRITNKCELPCTRTSDCSAPDVCDTNQGVCADCLNSDTQCTTAGEPRCFQEQCVQCLVGQDCGSAKQCWNHTCVTCVTNADCSAGTACSTSHECK